MGDFFGSIFVEVPNPKDLTEDQILEMLKCDRLVIGDGNILVLELLTRFKKRLDDLENEKCDDKKTISKEETTH